MLRINSDCLTTASVFYISPVFIIFRYVDLAYNWCLLLPLPEIVIVLTHKIELGVFNVLLRGRLRSLIHSVCWTIEG